MSLSSAQINELKSDLVQERARILGNVETLQSGFKSTLSEETDEHGLESHIGDQGTDTFLRAHDMSLEEHEQNLLAEVDAALSRIETGSFGICEADNKAIEIARLKAVPWARRCLRHAEA